MGSISGLLRRPAARAGLRGRFSIELHLQEKAAAAANGGFKILSNKQLILTVEGSLG
jgi:hypothetical protein